MQNLALSALAGTYIGGDFRQLLGRYFSAERIVEMRYSKSGGGKLPPKSVLVKKRLNAGKNNWSLSTLFNYAIMC